MIVVFVSKNEKEFRKYISGVSAKEQKEASLRNDGGLIWVSYKHEFSENNVPAKGPKSLRGRQNGKANAANSASVDSSTISCFVHKKKEEADYDYLILQGGQFKDDVRNNNFNDYASRRFLEVVKGAMNRFFGGEMDLSDVKLFVHWGLGSDLINTYEKPFQNVCDKLAKPLGFSKLSAYALSTRRSELFDVSRERIIVPQSVSEVLRLEDRFKDSAVDESFACCAARKETGKISDKDEDAMKARLERFKNRILRSRLSEKDKKAHLGSVARALAEIKKGNDYMNICDETSRLVAKILNKEVFNG